MEILIIIVAGIMIGASVYLMLSKSLIRIIIGTGILSHGILLMLLTMGGLKRGGIPVLDDSVQQYSDPLPQAMLLTVIVITFALTAYMLVIAIRVYRELGTDNVEELKGVPREDD
ncbi:Na(+)/H(+) antiporter subunit C [Lacicoccus alkaliphilus]|uniref:Multicomponent Na+:H+ antiporter subunit C n=1 Tax=Lacicoccus alkaliphilus DSM 16010 TaxID=1123231 RepID=A0A1M7FK37_9BACL|nr:Na(+)/H(+) antiporter subunit C [Salinicoccus alkaliphilus]SHM04373.1 multicomponent Na+:H+ antiporter subunit C [Salinicoccus alkaliphilus DSM 16010]